MSKKTISLGPLYKFRSKFNIFKKLDLSLLSKKFKNHPLLRSLLKRHSKVNLTKKRLSKVNLTKKRLSNLNISENCLQTILGTCLGDGSLKINKGYVNARFAMRHAIKFKPWFDWKVNQMKELASDKSIHIQHPSKGSYGKTDMIRFQTLTSTDLTTIHSIITKNNKVFIRRTWLNHFKPLALMCWWCDDGSLQTGWRQGVFCCENFSYKEQKTLVQYLSKVWSIKARVVKHPIEQKKK